MNRELRNLLRQHRAISIEWAAAHAEAFPPGLDYGDDVYFNSQKFLRAQFRLLEAMSESARIEAEIERLVEA
jgi:hypothetical protein